MDQVTKIVFAFDAITLKYAGPVTLNESDLSPEEEGVFLLPGNCLEAEPPTAPEGQWPFAVEGGWELQDLPQENDPEREPPTPEERRRALKAAVTMKRFAIETGGIELPDGTRLDTTREDQNAVANAIALADIAGVVSVDFKAASGWISITIPQLKQIGAAIGLHKQACYSAERIHHEAIDALAEEALAAYDFSSGWPTGSDPAALGDSA